MRPSGSVSGVTVRTGARILLAAGTALVPRSAPACSACWSLDQGLNAGFYWSYLLLTLLPFAVAGVIGVWVAHTLWRETRHQASGIPESSTIEKR